MLGLNFIKYKILNIVNLRVELLVFLKIYFLFRVFDEVSMVLIINGNIVCKVVRFC